MALLKAHEGSSPDTADIPEAPAENWKNAQCGVLSTVEGGHFMGEAVLDWLRRRGPGYQTVGAHDDVDGRDQPGHDNEIRP